MSATTPCGKAIPHEILLRIFTTLRSHDDFPSLLAFQRASKSIYSLLTPVLYKHLELTPGSASKLFGVLQTLTPEQVGQLYRPFDFAVEPSIEEREPPIQLPLGISVDLPIPHRLRVALGYTRSVVVNGPTPFTSYDVNLSTARAIAHSLRGLTKQLLFPNVRRISVRAGSGGVGWSPLDEKRHYEVIQSLAEGSRIDHFCLHDDHTLREGLSILRIFADPIDELIDEEEGNERRRRLESITVHRTKDLGLPLTLINPHKEMRWSFDWRKDRGGSEEDEDEFVGWILPMQMERLVAEIWKIESNTTSGGAGAGGPEKGWTIVLPFEDLDRFDGWFRKIYHGKVSDNRPFVEDLNHRYIRQMEKINREELGSGHVVENDEEEDFNYTDWIKQVRAGQAGTWPWMNKMVNEEEEKRRKVREMSKRPKVSWVAREKIQLNPCEACREAV